MITASNNTLWGIAGGQLEYVSQRIEMRRKGGFSWEEVVIIRFTDHDVQAHPRPELIEGIYYELEFPLSR